MSCSTKPWNSETVTQTAYFMEEKTYLEFGCGDSCAESEEGLERGREGGRGEKSGEGHHGKSDLFQKEC